MPFSRSGFSPIGLDIGRRTVEAVQLRADKGGGAPGNSGWKLHVASSISRSTPDVLPGETEMRRFLAALDRQGFRGRRFVLAAANEHLMTEVMELPPRSSGAPLADIAKAELARAHRCNEADLDMAMWEIPGPARVVAGAHHTHMMAAACKKADVAPLLAACSAAGADVIGLDARAWALARAAQGRLSPAPALNAVVDLSWGGALVAVCHGSTLVYQRTLHDAAVGVLASALSKDLRIESDIAEYVMTEVGLSGSAAGSEQAAAAGRTPRAREILAEFAVVAAREVTVSVQYAASRYGAGQAQRVLVTGLGASIPGLAAALATHTGVETSVLAPSDVIGIDPDAPACSKSTGMIPAIGLARYPMEAAA